jgi:hypothetical protein
MTSAKLCNALAHAIGTPAANEVLSILAAVETLGGSEAAFIDGVTEGTAAASKALVLDSSLNIGTINQLTATALIGALTGNVTGNVTGQVTFTTAARTATADGTGTGTIAAAGLLQFITVTSDDANKIIVLPAPTPATIVILHVAATGYELRSSAPATVAINGGAGAGAESAIGANTTVVMICATATSWKGFQLGSDGTLAQVEVAA